MSALAKIAAAGWAGGGAAQAVNGNYVDDVFSSYIYTGNGASQNIVNGVNFIGQPDALGTTINSRFSTKTYAGNGSVQNIVNDVNLQPQATVFGAEINSKFKTTLYTGNGATQSINTGIDLKGLTVDSTSWFNKTTDAVDYKVNEINVDTAGNVYHVGQSTNNYMTVVKQSSTGALLWQKSLWDDNRGFPIQAYGVSVDINGNVFVVARAGSGSEDSALLIKYNSSGVLQWQKVLNVVNAAASIWTPLRVIVDSAGNPYVAYSLNGAGSRTIISKFDTSGTQQWSRKLTNTSGFVNPYAFAESLSFDHTGALYVSGRASDNTGTYPFLAKYNTSGVLQWKKVYSGWQSTLKIVFDSVGNIYGIDNNVLIKFDNAGVIQWRKTIALGASGSISNLFVNSANEIYVTGKRYTGTTYNGFLLKFSNIGNLLSQHLFVIDGVSESFITGDVNYLYFLNSVYLAATGKTSRFVSKLTYSFLDNTSNGAIGDMSYTSTSVYTVSDDTTVLTDLSSYITEAIETTTPTTGPFVANNPAPTVVAGAVGVIAVDAGGLVWIKSRSAVTNHSLIDTVRGANKLLYSNHTSAQLSQSDNLTAFNSNGFSLGADLTAATANVNSQNYVAWTFKKAPKFFDIVQYTGDGNVSKTISHALGINPGFIIVKNMDNGSGNWKCYHRSLTSQGSQILLNASGAEVNLGSGINYDWTPTTTTFNVTSAQGTNLASTNYIAYVFAHDTDTVNGMIQCGTFTTDAGGLASVTLGWEPQFILTKRIDATRDWLMGDITRGMNSSVGTLGLSPDLTNAEAAYNMAIPNSTGFNANIIANGTFVYMAIRKPETTGGGLIWTKWRSGVYGASSHMLVDTVKGISNALSSDLTNGTDIQVNGITAINANGYTLGSMGTFNGYSGGAPNYVSWAFKKAPKFFDIVTYVGNSNTQNISHALTVQPGMVIIKNTTQSATNWVVWHRDGAYGHYTLLNSVNHQDPTFSKNYFGNISTSVDPTSSVFTVGNHNDVNGNGNTYVAYLFAHDPDTVNGMIQCGIYYGNSSTSGPIVTLGWEPQMLLVKKVANGSVGGWVMMDTTRNIGTGNTSFLYANSNAAESTGNDGVITSSTGFQVNSINTQINESSCGYIFMAIRKPSSVNGSGGMVWIKSRSNALDHGLYDTVRNRKRLTSNDTTAQVSYGTGNLVDTFNTNGFTLGTDIGISTNSAGIKYISWAFKRAAKFFDIVTFPFIGNGPNANKRISHNLGIAPGMIIIKRLDGTGSWYVYHRSIGVNNYLALDLTAGIGSPMNIWGTADPTINDFGMNESIFATGTWVAYLFAHDPNTVDGKIQCGTFTTDAGGTATVTLGYEPQFVMVKRKDGVSDWITLDVMRGWSLSGYASLKPNTTAAETISDGGEGLTPTATGFKMAAILSVSAQYVYMAIRRPNKPPTSGIQVFNAITRTGTSGVAAVTGVGFAPDMSMTKRRNGTSTTPAVLDRQRGASRALYPNTTAAETISDTTIATSFDQDGITFGDQSGVNLSASTYINYFFKRAVGVFDEVCYIGTGVNKTETHNLGAIPELMIVKNRNMGGQSWTVYASGIGPTRYLQLESAAAADIQQAMWNNTSPTSTNFTVGTHGYVNGSTWTYIAYLFATKAGVSKVFSYTGNGTSQTIPCGFATGARFILIKRTDVGGDWYIWDTVRGIVAGNDPHSSLNNSLAEITTDDSINPDASGFIVNQVAATNINISAASYIGFAIT